MQGLMGLFRQARGQGALLSPHSRTQTLPDCRTGARSAQWGPCSEAQGAPPSSLKAGLTHAPSAVRVSSSDTGCPTETALAHPQNLGFRIRSLLKRQDRWESTRQQCVGRGRVKGRVRPLAQHVHRYRQREPLEQACQTRSPWGACLVNEFDKLALEGRGLWPGWRGPCFAGA